MNLAVAILNVAFIAIITYRVWLKDQSPIKPVFWIAFVFRLFAGIALGLVYTYYYATGDTFQYFYDGVRLADLARHDLSSYLAFLWSGDDSFPVWSELTYRQPRAIFLSKIASVFCLMSADNYWIISLYFSTISFFGAWVITKKILMLFPNSQVEVTIAFLFFPSVVFWSAGLIKESLAMAALFFLSFIFLKTWFRQRVVLLEWLLCFFSLWCLWNLKYYYLAVFLPLAATALMSRWLIERLRVRKLIFKLLLWSFIFVLPLALVSILHPNFYPERFMDVVVSSYYEYHSISAVEDVIHFHSLKATPLAITKNIPLAILSGLYRPSLFEAQTTFQFFIALENVFILILTIGALARLKKIIHGKHRLLVFTLLVYIIVLCVFLTLSTPNFGTLSRYRIGFLPFFVLLLLSENPWVTRIIKSKWPGNLAP